MDKLRKERMEQAVKANAIVEGAKAAVRSLSADEKAELDGLLKSIEVIDARIVEAEADERRMAAINGLTSGEKAGRADSDREPVEQTDAATLGEHFVKSMKAAGRSLRQTGTYVAPEVKAATDTHVTGGANGFYAPWLTDRQMTGGVRPVRDQPVIQDLISWASTSAQLIEYLEYPAQMLEGSAGFVNEGGSKPQVHILEPTWRQDPVRELAAWFKITDDTAEDLPFIVSEINRQLQYNFVDVEGRALLKGDGVAPGLLGILNRSGVQVHSVAGATPSKLAEAIFVAAQKVQTATGFAADAVIINPADYQAIRLMKDATSVILVVGVLHEADSLVVSRADAVIINPADYQAIRLMKDANDQYYAGGVFGNNYGQDGLSWQPPLWGLKTVVSSTATVGEPIVGAFKASVTGYRKGGLKIESTNSHVDDFTNDRITIRMREKLGLAVRYPAGIVKLTKAS